MRRNRTGRSPCFCLPRSLRSSQIKRRGPARCGPSLWRVYPMGSMSIWHWIVVIGVVLLLFGRGKISELMGDVAQGIKSFKKGMADDNDTAEEPAKPEPKVIEHKATKPEAPSTKSASRAKAPRNRKSG